MSHIDDGMLHTWLDGETSSAEAERIDRHLASCDGCNARLDAMARVHALAAELVASAEDASAPAWEELVARAQAADAAASPSAAQEPFGAAEPVSDRGIAAGDTGPPVAPRGVWTPRLLTSGLAWAATLVLAFGLGWYAGLGPGAGPAATEQALAGLGPATGPAATEQALAELSPGARPPAPEQAMAALEPEAEETVSAPAVQEPTAAGAVVDAVAPTATPTLGEAEFVAPAESNKPVRAELERTVTVEPTAGSARSQDAGQASRAGVERAATVGPTAVAARSEDARQVSKVGFEQHELAELLAMAEPDVAEPEVGEAELDEAELDEADVNEAEVSSSVGGERRDNAVKADRAPPAQMRASPARQRQALAAADEAANERFADAAGRNPGPNPDSDLDAAPIALQDIAGWLGSEPLRLEGAVLASATVGPLTAGFDDSELPGVWMLFDDPQTGLRVAVAQGRWQQGEADNQPEPPTGVDAAVLTIAPDGEPQLWWVTADGFLVLVTADADEATLRNLARRVQ